MLAYDLSVCTELHKIASFLELQNWCLGTPPVCGGVRIAVHTACVSPSTAVSNNKWKYIFVCLQQLTAVDSSGRGLLVSGHFHPQTEVWCVVGVFTAVHVWMGQHEAV